MGRLDVPRNARYCLLPLLLLVFMGSFLTKWSPISQNLNRKDIVHMPHPVNGNWDNMEGRSCQTKPLSNMSQLYDYINKTTMHCDNPVRVGGKLDRKKDSTGDKMVCMDDKFNIVKGNCKVLSFGIAHDWTFDDDVDKRLNCKVYCFDHTNGMGVHNRSANIQFFPIGLSDIDTKKVKRYSTILEMLGLQDSIIDILKIDIENAEINFFKDVFSRTPHLLDNVKQIAMEVHPERGQLTKMQKQLWEYFQLMECYGFKIMFTNMIPIKVLQWGPVGNRRACCYEIVWARDRSW